MGYLSGFVFEIKRLVCLKIIIIKFLYKNVIISKYKNGKNYFYIYD